jgi:membrane associated rhomboid family serine protease
VGVSPRGFNRSVTILGERVPLPIVVLVGSVLGASILGAIGARNGVGFPLLRWGVLIPALVWSGQVWRLVTWTFFELNPFNLVFGCLALWWVGGALSQTWGPARFLRFSFAILALAAGITCLLALLWPALMTTPVLGIWPLVDALIITFASISPYTVVRLFFVFPVQGRHLIYLIVALTLVYGLLQDIAEVVPHLVAEGLVILYFRDTGLRRLWLNLRLSRLERGLRRRSSPLREVRRPEGAPPRWFH